MTRDPPTRSPWSSRSCCAGCGVAVLADGGAATTGRRSCIPLQRLPLMFSHAKHLGARHDVRDVPSGGDDLALGGRQPDPDRGGVPRVPPDRSRGARASRRRRAAARVPRRVIPGYDAGRAGRARLPDAAAAQVRSQRAREDAVRELPRRSAKVDLATTRQLPTMASCLALPPRRQRASASAPTVTSRSSAASSRRGSRTARWCRGARGLGDEHGPGFANDHTQEARSVGATCTRVPRSHRSASRATRASSKPLDFHRGNYLVDARGRGEARHAGLLGVPPRAVVLRRLSRALGDREPRSTRELRRGDPVRAFHPPGWASRGRRGRTCTRARRGATSRAARRATARTTACACHSAEPSALRASPHPQGLARQRAVPGARPRQSPDVPALPRHAGRARLRLVEAVSCWRLHVAEARRHVEAAVAVAELDRLGVADGERLGEQPLRDRVRQRVLVARVPQPHGHARCPSSTRAGTRAGAARGRRRRPPRRTRPAARRTRATRRSARGPRRRAGAAAQRVNAGLERVEPAVAQPARERRRRPGRATGGAPSAARVGDPRELVGDRAGDLAERAIDGAERRIELERAAREPACASRRRRARRPRRGPWSRAAARRVARTRGARRPRGGIASGARAAARGASERRPARRSSVAGRGRRSPAPGAARRRGRRGRRRRAARASCGDAARAASAPAARARPARRRRRRAARRRPRGSTSAASRASARRRRRRASSAHAPRSAASTASHSPASSRTSGMVLDHASPSSAASWRAVSASPRAAASSAVTTTSASPSGTRWSRRAAIHASPPGDGAVRERPRGAAQPYASRRARLDEGAAVEREPHRAERDEHVARRASGCEPAASRAITSDRERRATTAERPEQQRRTPRAERRASRRSISAGERRPQRGSATCDRGGARRSPRGAAATSSRVRAAAYTRLRPPPHGRQPSARRSPARAAGDAAGVGGASARAAARGAPTARRRAGGTDRAAPRRPRARASAVRGCGPSGVA